MSASFRQLSQREGNRLIDPASSIINALGGRQMLGYLRCDGKLF